MKAQEEMYSHMAYLGDRRAGAGRTIRLCIAHGCASMYWSQWRVSACPWTRRETARWNAGVCGTAREKMSVASGRDEVQGRTG
jgi:hypothetical protein